jgi:hypothetical protein
MDILHKHLYFVILASILLNHGYEVLEINYDYKKEDYKQFTFEEIVKAISFDTYAVIQKVLSGKNYDKFCFVSKSLGTIPLGNLLENELFKRAKVIWLTPLLQNESVYLSIKESTNSGLLIIGENDPIYKKERFENLLQNENIIFNRIPNVNHQLEYAESVIDSINVLKEIMFEIQQFIIND